MTALPLGVLKHDLSPLRKEFNSIPFDCPYLLKIPCRTTVAADHHHPLSPPWAFRGVSIMFRLPDH